MVSSKVFDYIVVGGGSAGCVVANRLSRDPQVSVCLVEAGPSDRQWPYNLLTTVPLGMLRLMRSDRTNWKHVLLGTQAMAGRELPSPRGRVLGGTSTINGMVYTRGHPTDYDEWEALGNPGWSYQNVLPFFKRHEDFEAGESPYHGVGGELRVEALKRPHPLAKAFIDAAANAGFDRNTDFSGPDHEGFGVNHLTQRSGERVSSARAFLHPVIHRPNLTLLDETLVTRLRLQGKEVAGLDALRHGESIELFAKRETVLCGGSINSPQLLLLSGIGPLKELRDIGVTPIHELPGVGKNFQDHPAIVSMSAEKSGLSPALTPRGIMPLAMAPFDYLLRRRGIFAQSMVQCGGYIRTDPTLARADVKLELIPMLRPFGQLISKQHGFSVYAWLLRPRSRGELKLRSNDPLARPDIQSNFFSEKEDIASLVKALRTVRRILTQPSFQKFRPCELVPGDAAASDEQLADFILQHSGTVYHPAGTCKMGPADDPAAVVDAQLRVHGLQRLRVADVSIMPTIIAGNTNAPAMMIGERAADFILSGTN